jgi:hypothetical protein
MDGAGLLTGLKGRDAAGGAIYGAVKKVERSS